MGSCIKKENVQVEVLNTQAELNRFHQDAELLYILEGRMDLQIGEYQLRLPSDGIYVVNGGKKYSYTAPDNILFVRLAIPTQLVCQVNQVANIIFWCDSTREDNRSYDELRRLLKRLLNRHLSIPDRNSDFGYLALCYQVMDLLSTNFLLRMTDRESADDGDHFGERIAQIDNYVNTNFNRQISSKDLAEKLFLSQGYLSRFFKKNYGMSFAEYLTDVRLRHAVDDLIYTTAPITHIAYDNGFSNMASFNKAFKDRYKEAPSTMRRKLKEQKNASAELMEDASLQQRLEEFLRMDGNIRESAAEAAIMQADCCVLDTVPLKNSWGGTINIGSAADLLKSEVRDHVAVLADMLRFRYVRFWNIFSKEMLIDPNAPNGSYNFSKLDTILDFLLEQGLKPHIELGIKPKRLYRTVQNAIIEESLDVDVPNDVFQKFLHTLMSHLLRRYRRSELNTWRIELWFPERAWGQVEAAENYYTKFDILCRTVKEYAEQMEVGGCGMRLFETGKFEHRFLERWRERPMQPDFVSVYCYAYKRGEINGDRYSKQSVDNDSLAHAIAKMKALVAQAGLGHKKVYVTEWNLTVSDRNYINDTCFKGAYIMKNVIDNYGQIDLLAYFLGSDRVSEHYDSDGMLYGGSGLLSKDGIMKAAGYAFRFLGWLYSYYVGKGKNYLVTTDRHDSYGIVCHNQKVLNHNYYLSKEDEIQREHIWKYFEDRDALELTLQLTGVSDGIYQVKTYQINEQVGGALQIWREMGYETELSRNDIKYLQRVCGPKLTIQTLEARNNVLPLSIKLSPNEIRFIRLRHLS